LSLECATWHHKLKTLRRLSTLRLQRPHVQDLIVGV
ncbi:hypothetical protein RRG08_011625, partial [Elysia crispata]